MTIVNPPAPVEPTVVPPVVEPVIDPNPPATPPEPVSYETHRKLLSEKKRLQEEYAKLAAKEAEREKKILEDRGEYQKLAELAKAEAEELRSKLTSIEETRREAKKANALLKALDNGILEKYYGFLPLDSILVDPETGEVNQLSVVKAAEEFRRNYPELMVQTGGPKLPNVAPKGNGAGKISREEWLKLPHNEMIKWKPDQVV